MAGQTAQNQRPVDIQTDISATSIITEPKEIQVIKEGYWPKSGTMRANSR